MKKSRSQKVIEGRQKNPIARLAHRWNTNVRGHWPEAPKTLGTMDTVRYVYLRWGGKSVISGENNPLHLCVTPFSGLKEIPEKMDLVLVTTKEAQTLGRLSQEERQARFPESIRAKIERIK